MGYAAPALGKNRSFQNGDVSVVRKEHSVHTPELAVQVTLPNGAGSQVPLLIDVVVPYDTSNDSSSKPELEDPATRMAETS
jgi:hypothetical protein